MCLQLSELLSIEFELFAWSEKKSRLILICSLGNFGSSVLLHLKSYVGSLSLGSLGGKTWE